MDDYREQLYRYAQDLDDLLEQHGKLQQRYQSLLQQQGRAPNSNDQLLDLMIRSRQALVVTDTSGRIVRANRAAREFLRGAGSETVAMGNLYHCVAPDDRVAFAELLDRFAVNVSSEATVLCRFDQIDPDDADRTHAFAMLAVPVRNAGHTHVYWLMRPMADGAEATPAPQMVLPMDSGIYGVMVTDVKAVISAANLTFGSITEYGPEELLGQSAKLLSSGRHSAEFYQAFWARLTALGQWTGEFLNRRKSGHVYPEWKTVKAVQDIEGQTTHYVAVVRDISEDDNSIEQLSRLAYFDGLTGLPNRRMLDDRLSQATKAARRKGSGLSVLFIDLDHFKPVNDQFGHDVGDLVLQQIGGRMQAAVRAADTVARVGGDEFVVLLPETSSQEQVQGVVDKLLAAVGAPVVVGEHHHTLGASLGCAIFPGDGEDADTLVRHADAAMYRSKRQGGSRVCFFAEQAEASTHDALGGELWSTVERGEMHLVYQPQVTADPGHHLRGCEALLRWTHPRHGAIGPETFIGMAEDSGAIVPLGQWVLATACAQMRQWLDAGLSDCFVSVNISYRQLQNAGFAAGVLAILQQTGLPPALLELELTESASSRLEAQHLAQLQDLRAQGIRLAIDDFGVGHSSLKRLLSMPADTLKIDRLFVRDLGTNNESRALVNCMVGVSTALGMRVVAEGVENQQQIDVLASLGCHLLQGFYTAPPMEAETCFAWMQQRTALGRPVAAPTAPHG